jgi:hypothetical protein
MSPAVTMAVAAAGMAATAATATALTSIRDAGRNDPDLSRAPG